MHNSPMSPLRGSVLAVVLLAVVALSGCGKTEEPPVDRDPNATTMRMTGPDGAEVSADIVETENGMKMRVRGADGKESSIEMELPEGFRAPGAGGGQTGARGDAFSDFDRRFDERSEQFRKRFDERVEEFDRRFEENRKAFDRRFEEDQRPIDERQRSMGRPSAPRMAAPPSPSPDAVEAATGDRNIPVDEDR